MRSRPQEGAGDAAAAPIGFDLNRDFGCAVEPINRRPSGLDCAAQHAAFEIAKNESTVPVYAARIAIDKAVADLKPEAPTPRIVIEPA